MKKTHAELRAEIEKALDTPQGRKIAADLEARLAVQEKSLCRQGFPEKQATWLALSIVMDGLDADGREVTVTAESGPSNKEAR
jgi:hypothetical protein